MKKNTKTYYNLTLEDVKEIKTIILKGLKYNSDNIETILKLAKSIALDMHFYNEDFRFRCDIEKVKQNYYISYGCTKRFEKLKKYSEKCNNLWLSTALESLSNL